MSCLKLSHNTTKEKGQYKNCRCEGELRVHLQREQQKKGLHRVEAAVHKIAHEKVICLRAVAANREQLHEIKELAMYVAACRAKHNTIRKSL